MNIGGGEAADQMVRMMLTGTEVTVRLGASALKNLLAITLALAKHHKTLSGKVNMGKMLRETRDIRMFPMSPEQYQAFKQRAVKQKILFSVIRDSDGRGKVVDVAMPVTELERANLIFERIRYLPQDRQSTPAKEQSPMRDSQIREERTLKKESRSEFDLAGISGSSIRSLRGISLRVNGFCINQCFKLLFFLFHLLNSILNFLFILGSFQTFCISLFRQFIFFLLNLFYSADFF